MLFLLWILCIVFASFEYNFEEGGKDPWDGPTPFISIPAAMWWCIVTVMMVGYGDMVPTTIPGMITAGLCIVIGIMLMALPISVIGTNFSQAWDNRKEEEKQDNAVDVDLVEIAETSLAEVSHDLNVFNNACANHVELCKNSYLELISPSIRRIWKYFKKYT